MSNNLKLSIIITTYDDTQYKYSDYLERAIKSAVVQEWPHEVIVVDDGSPYPDKIKSIVTSFNSNLVKLLICKENHGGPAFARNFGIQHASGKFILPLDSDDQLTTDASIIGCSSLLTRPEASVAYGPMIDINTKKYSWIPAHTWTLRDLLFNDQLPYGSVFTKEAWEKVGGYDDKIIGYDDWDFWILLAASSHSFIYTWQPMLMYKWPQDNDSNHLSTTALKNKAQMDNHIREKHKNLFIASNEILDRIVATPV